jgi:hypothetical protein
MATSEAPQLTPQQIARNIAVAAGCRIRVAVLASIELEKKTIAGGTVSAVVSLETRNFGGYGFSPNGWTHNHFASANAAMATLLCVAEAIWDACEVA